VPDLDDEESGETIEVLVALVVPDVGAVTSGDDGDVAASLVGRVAREVHPQVFACALGETVVAGLVDVLR